MTANIGPDARLKEAIKAEIARRGIQYKDAAIELGITRGYLARILCRGGKMPTRDSRLRIFAEFLSVPVEEVYRLIGIISSSDHHATQSIEQELEASFRRMQHNRTWAVFAPSQDEWESLPEKSKLFMSRLFEKTTYEEYLQRTTAGRGHHRRLKKN
jgi:transcriptional regulator with XRE-family HTH domain